MKAATIELHGYKPEGSVGCQTIIHPNILAGKRNLKKLASPGSQGNSEKVSNRYQFNLVGSFQPGIFLVVWYSYPYGIMKLVSNSGHKQRPYQITQDSSRQTEVTE